MWHQNEGQVKEAIGRLSAMAKVKTSDDELVKDIVGNAFHRLWKCGRFNHEKTFTEEMYTYCYRVIRSALDDELKKNGVATPKPKVAYALEVEEWERRQKDVPDETKPKPVRYIQHSSDDDVFITQDENQHQQAHRKLTSTELKVYAMEVFPVLRDVINELIDIEYTVNPLKAMYLYLLITNTTELSMADLSRRLGRKDSHPSQTFNRFCAKVETHIFDKGYPLMIEQTTLEDFEIKAEG